jgi:heme A synthase
MFVLSNKHDLIESESIYYTKHPYSLLIILWDSNSFIQIEHICFHYLVSKSASMPDIFISYAIIHQPQNNKYGSLDCLFLTAVVILGVWLCCG